MKSQSIFKSQMRDDEPELSEDPEPLDEETKTPEKSFEKPEQDSALNGFGSEPNEQSGDSKRFQNKTLNSLYGIATKYRDFTNDHYNMLQNFIDQTHQVNWDIPLKARTKFIGHTGRPVHFCWGNGIHLTNLISCDDMGQVVHWSGRKGKKITVSNLGAPLTWIDLEPSQGRRAITGSVNGCVYLVELNMESKGKVIKGSGKNYKIDTFQGPVTACKFLSENVLVSGSSEKWVSIWDLTEKNSLVSRHQLHDGAIASLDVSEEDPNIFLTASTDKTCKIWDIRIKNPVQQEYKSHLAAVNDIEFMPGMLSCFASGSQDGSIRIFDLRITKEVAILIDKMNPHAIHSISFSPSGRVIMAGTEERRMKAWDTFYDADPFQYFDYGYQVGMQWAKISKDGFTLGVLGKDGVMGIAY